MMRPGKDIKAGTSQFANSARQKLESAKSAVSLHWTVLSLRQCAVASSRKVAVPDPLTSEIARKITQANFGCDTESLALKSCRIQHSHRAAIYSRWMVVVPHQPLRHCQFQ